MMRILSLSLWLAVGATLTSAAPVVYQFTIDTSSLAGSGFLDIQFNPGTTPGFEPATATFSNFSMGTGTLNGAPTNTGGVSSDLAALIISLVNDLNQTLQPVTWGNQISFLVTLSGTLIENPDPGGFIGALFSVSLLDSTQTNFLLGGPPLAGLDIAPAALGITPFNNGAPGIVGISEVPEPATWLLVGAGLVGLGALRRKRA